MQCSFYYYTNVVNQNRISFCSERDQGDIEYNIKRGNEALSRNDFDKAIKYFENVLAINSDESQAYLGLAKVYKLKKDYKLASQNLEKYLCNNKNDFEYITMLGEMYRQQKLYSKAKEQFYKALSIEPYFDCAKRNLYEVLNLELNEQNPKEAFDFKCSYAKKNLTRSLQMSLATLSKEDIEKIRDVQVVFDVTSELGGRGNIAQYEHDKRKITVTSDYIYASSELVAAYLIHEFVHAKDNDPYTSIREEQDAYNEAAKFWIKHNHGIKDAEMDYVVELYKESQATLENRVKDVYKLRDPSISLTSPNHRLNINTNAYNITSKDTHQESDLKKYSIIA